MISIRWYLGVSQRVVGGLGAASSGRAQISTKAPCGLHLMVVGAPQRAVTKGPKDPNMEYVGFLY